VTKRQRLRIARSVWRSKRHAICCDLLPAAANGKVTTARKRKRPSHCGLRTWTIVCDAMRLLAQVAEEGLEGGPFSSVKAPLFHHDGAKSGAVPDDLLWVIEAWPKLNESTKADMIAMVRAE